MRDYTVAKEFKVGNFDIIVDWTYEDLSLDYVFETAEEVAVHAKRCNDWLDTHYAARVRAMYNGVEMGCDYLGSCYAYECTPEEDIEKEISGYLEQMIDTALDQAQTEAVAMLDRLKADFLS